MKSTIYITLAGFALFSYSPAHAQETHSVQASSATAPQSYIPDYANLFAPDKGGAKPGPAVIRVRTAGDTMLGNAHDGRLPSGNPLSPVLGLLSDADFTFLNLEGPVCDIDGIESKCEKRQKELKRKRRKETESKCYVFRSPRKSADYLNLAGVDAVSLSNNHLFDFDIDCATSTYHLMLERGIKPFGFKLRISATDESTLAHADVNGHSVALAGFNFSTSGGYLLSVQDIERAEKLVHAAKKSHDYVFVSFHAGAEGAKHSHVPDGTEYYFTENRGDVKKFARRMIDAGAALVAGHSPHVLRGMEIYKGRLIAYSLGNFATYAGFSLQSPNNLGAILEAALDSDGRLAYGAIFPTIQSYATCDDKPCTTLALDTQQRGLKRIRELSLADFPGSAPKITD
ncbi:MAG TPA: CapA family protein [Elusimicrobiales bacterium]|nr:CapA family protein [Elusimicrobiales bacterium]